MQLRRRRLVLLARRLLRAPFGLLGGGTFHVTARHAGSVVPYPRRVPPALAVHALEKRYGPVHALRGVDLLVEEGELVGLLGPNGAGKSTLVKIAVGLVRATRGQAEVAGARAGSRAARAELGYLAELFRFPGWYTADEVLTLHQRLTHSDGGAAERGRLLERVALDDARDRRVDGMSKGMQQRSNRAGAGRLATRAPSRRPTSALDPAAAGSSALLEELRGRGVSVLLNSHLLSEIELVCDRVAILRAGEVVSAGAPAELSRPRGVELETDQGTRTIEGATREDAPRLVAEAVAAGRQVYGVRVLTSTLEDTYLEAVGDEVS